MTTALGVEIGPVSMMDESVDLAVLRAHLERFRDSVEAESSAVALRNRLLAVSGQIPSRTAQQLRPEIDRIFGGSAAFPMRPPVHSIRPIAATPPTADQREQARNFFDRMIQVVDAYVAFRNRVLANEGLPRAEVRRIVLATIVAIDAERPGDFIWSYQVAERAELSNPQIGDAVEHWESVGAVDIVNSSGSIGTSEVISVLRLTSLGRDMADDARPPASAFDLRLGAGGSPLIQNTFHQVGAVQFGDGNRAEVQQSFGGQHAAIEESLERLRTHLATLSAAEQAEAEPFVHAIETEAKSPKPVLSRVIAMVRALGRTIGTAAVDETTKEFIENVADGLSSFGGG